MMEMMDNLYHHPYASSTMSSETLSGSCGSRTNRVRTVRLVRPLHAGTLPPPSLTCRHGPSLGFSIRGGREHGTGFFVSHVEPASEAHRQGLRVGDQIIRVNGFTVDDAVHKEVLQLVSNHTRLTLKVRSVGMIPVKDKKSDALSWQIITANTTATTTDNSSMRSSPPLMLLPGEKIHDVRINVMVAPRSKLGCGICKGPEWKPGIFVQFTKEGGIAREAGLRPGDQILYCNNVDFSDIIFNEAVNLMKTSRQLDLIVRKSAGSELFPGESSGYNSSASSVTGDQSPSWSDSKRLSIVKEEAALDLDKKWHHQKNFLQQTKSWDDQSSVMSCSETEEERRQYFKPTIINLSENGTTIKNNGEEDEHKGPPVLLQHHPREKVETMVVVEVHRSGEDQQQVKEKEVTGEIADDKNDNLAKSVSTGSFSSFSSCSLSSAICQEIQRRSEKKVQPVETKPSIDEQLQINKILKGVTSEKQHQHSRLMDEFKKAHRRMFKNTEEENTSQEPSRNLSSNNNNTMDRLASHELSQKLSERLSTLTSAKEVGNHHHAVLANRHSIAGPPPPPPPFPANDDGDNSGTKSCTATLLKPKKPKAPPVPIKTSTLSYHQPPPCPTPDYDTLSITSSSSSAVLTKAKTQNSGTNKSSQDRVEMDSLESFKLNNPISGNQPRPPDTYFSINGLNKKNSSSNCSDSSINIGTMSLKKRPVSVVIGEYPSGTIRRQPQKLDFLHGHHNGQGSNGPITNQLASELAQTLNRSNLKRRTESMENLLNFCPQIKPQSNGSVRISLSSSRSLAKSTDDLSTLESLSRAFANRVTINIKNSKADDSGSDRKKSTGEVPPAPPPPSILKTNGGGNSQKAPLMQQKSITFGEM